MTIYDIAKLAGVSASSVSRVINGKPGVNQETREKIQALLLQYNYVQDVNARNLVMQKSRMIGILMDNINTDDLRMGEGLMKVEYELMRGGYYCFVKYIGQEENAIEEGIKDLACHRVEGAILLGAVFRQTAAVKKAVERYLRGIPVVMASREEELILDNIYTIDSDEKTGFHRCVELMARKKHKNLALLVDKSRPSESIIVDGFQSGIRSIPDAAGVVYRGVPASINGGTAAAQRALKEYPKLDGLICANDLIAIGALNALQDRGLRVPEQVAVLGEDNSAFCEVCRPKLSSLDTLLSSALLTTARTMLDLLGGRQVSHHVQLQMRIVERETT